MKYYLIGLVILFAVSCNKQDIKPGQSGIQVFGGSLNDAGRHIMKDADGNIVIYGFVDEIESQDFGDTMGRSSLHIIKLDAEGRLLWERSIKSSEILLSSGFAIQNGNYLFVSFIDSFDVWNKAHLIMMSRDGNIIFEKDLPKNVFYNLPTGIKACKEGGFIISFSYLSHDFNFFGGLTKIDNQGNVIWELDLPDTLLNGVSNKLFDVVQLRDGSYIATGQIDFEGFSGQKSDILLLHINATGKMLWHKSFGNNKLDLPAQLKPLPEGGIVLLGHTNIDGKNSQFLLVKFDDSGNIVWQKDFGSEGDNHYVAYGYYDQFYRPGMGFDICKDGSFIITGSFGKGARHDPSSVLLIKADKNGNTLWEKTYGGNQTSTGYDVVELNNGGYAVTGFTQAFGNNKNGKDILLILTDANGNIK